MVIPSSTLHFLFKVCPGLMVASADGRPTHKFYPRANLLDPNAHADGGPSMTYEDVAEVIVAVANVVRSGFAGHQIGLALHAHAFPEL